jgi:hypothetical protein
VVRTGWPLSRPSNKRLCNRYSKPLFAVVTYHLRNLALVGAGEESAALSPRVVSMRMSSGPSKRKLKPALRRVDLGRGDAQVEQQPVDARDAARGQGRGQLREARVDDLEAFVVDPRRALARCRDRGRILVEAQHAGLRAEAGQQRARVAAAAEGAVDVDAVRAREQRVDGFVEQDGGVRPRVSTVVVRRRECRGPRRRSLS